MIEVDRRYLFGGEAVAKLITDCPRTDYFEDARFAWSHKEREAHALFFLGPAGSGVTLHEHTNAWNALVHGQKRWILLPPYSQFGPVSLPANVWMKEWYPRFQDVVHECTQFAGELMYVPSNWMHSTLNVQASIGIAVEVGYNTQLLDRLINS